MKANFIHVSLCVHFCIIANTQFATLSCPLTHSLTNVHVYITFPVRSTIDIGAERRTHVFAWLVLLCALAEQDVVTMGARREGGKGGCLPAPWNLKK